MKTTREAHDFYRSPEWLNTRNAYLISKHGICERCGRPAVIVHHKTHLTKGNINDWTTRCDFTNLECVCQSCHNAEHKSVDTTKRKGTTWERILKG